MDVVDFIAGIPTVTVQLDRPRVIAFTLGALRRVREKLGTLDIDLEKPEATQSLPTYLWACLPAKGRAELSIEQIEDMIHPGNLVSISEALGALFRASVPDGENPTQAAPETPAAAT